ncbi:hypothetical protein IE077_001517 [Cardiosporidium cionae]|uniref:Uncharacterized protein n=1 Tax=Cardiosporidium cionae TaxID=476202 RepID=A0ABQ7J5B2_9APIC|nr:hypothetical protein IE077_001517 [Cardiosporidium cionae]|eukprot:KAF8819172.1 hypothetical protein IE077_001517 [Cardiosporidium cionae]
MAVTSQDPPCTSSSYQLSPSQREIYKLTLKGLVEFASLYCARKENIHNRLHVTDDCMIAIKDVAKSAFCKYPWCVLKVVLIARLQEVCHTLYEHCRDYSVEDVDLYTFISTLESLTLCLLQLIYPPVTLQRLCEILVSSPYRNIEKLMACIRKLVTVRTPHYEMLCIPEGIDWQQYPELSIIEERLSTMVETKDDLEWMEMESGLPHRSRSPSSGGTFVEADPPSTSRRRKRKQLSEGNAYYSPSDMENNEGEPKMVFIQPHSYAADDDGDSSSLGLKRRCHSTSLCDEEFSSGKLLPMHEVSRNSAIDGKQPQKQSRANSVRILATVNDYASPLSFLTAPSKKSSSLSLFSQENAPREDTPVSPRANDSALQSSVEFNDNAISPHLSSSLIYPAPSSNSDMQCSSRTILFAD